MTEMLNADLEIERKHFQVETKAVGLHEISAPGSTSADRRKGSMKNTTLGFGRICKRRHAGDAETVSKPEDRLL